MMRHTSTSRHRTLALALVCALAWCCASPLRAQEEQDDLEFDGLNFAFAAVAGSGYYNFDGRQTLILRIPIAYPLWTAEERKWGVRLTFPITLGFYDFDPNDILEGIFPERVATVGGVAGVELSHRITGNWTVYPLTMVGPAVELETKSTGWVCALGTRSRAEFPWGPRTMVLWNRLIYALNFANDSAVDDDFVEFETDFEIRQPVTPKTSVGFIVASELFFNKLIVFRPEEAFAVTRRWEVSVSYGPTAGDVKLWKFKLPRISVGVRFGQSFAGFKLGFRYKY